MKHMLERPADREPIGIVIADGGRGDGAPTRFSAFVWGPVPEELDVRDERGELVAAHG
ncbi:MAG: hypothetical protein ACK54K_11025 [Gemmatimonadaceae bacterium]|jgi:hypothetical protein